MIEGTAATARIGIDNGTGHRFTDFFTRVRPDGRWLVLGKMFHMHPEN